MKYTQKLFVYQRREMAVLSLLGLSILAFIFTLGVHWAKHVARPTDTIQAGTHALMSATPEPELNREELSDPGPDASEVLDDSLNRKIHEEVSNTGIKLRQAQPTALPQAAKSKNAGAVQAH